MAADPERKDEGVPVDSAWASCIVHDAPLGLDLEGAECLSGQVRRRVVHTRGY